MTYSWTFLTVAIVMVLTPGADFAVIVRNTVAGGRGYRRGNYTAIAAERLQAGIPVQRDQPQDPGVLPRHLAWGALPYERDVWVCLVAGGEAFEDLLHSPEWQGGGDLDVAAVAARLADHLQDWVCETAFAWGQLRPVEYILPAP